MSKPRTSLIAPSNARQLKAFSSSFAIFFFELFGFWFWSWDFPKSLRSLLSAWNTMDVTENLLDEWLWQKKVGLKKMLRSPFLCIMCIRVEKTSTNHGRLVPTKWLKKTLQKCSFLKTFNWWCVHILGCAWARASNIHTSKQAYSLARKLDVLWLRHEWIYVLETKLLRTTTSYSHLAAFEMGIPAPLGTARVYH